MEPIPVRPLPHAPSGPAEPTDDDLLVWYAAFAELLGTPLVGGLHGADEAPVGHMPPAVPPKLSDIRAAYRILGPGPLGSEPIWDTRRRSKAHQAAHMCGWRHD